MNRTFDHMVRAVVTSVALLCCAYMPVHCEEVEWPAGG